MNTLKDFLELIISKKASDLHFTIGSEPRMRINGNIENIETSKMISSDYLKEIFSPYLTSKQKENINNNIEVDLTIVKSLVTITHFFYYYKQ